MISSIVLVNGKSGSGKDYLIDRVLKQIKDDKLYPKNTIKSFAHADILKEYLSNMFNIKISNFYSPEKDKLYIQFNRADLFNKAKIYTLKDIDKLGDKALIWDESDIEVFCSTSNIEHAFSPKCDKQIFTSLRTLLVYYGFNIMKKRMPPYLLLYQSLNQLFSTKSFKNVSCLIITDNRFEEEIEFFQKFAVKNDIKLKYLQITSTQSNDLNNICEKSLNFDDRRWSEEIKENENLLRIDNSDRTSLATQENIDKIIKFIGS